nr:MAG TPA: hypothetical protein [Caudoviricetes sp.]
MIITTLLSDDFSLAESEVNEVWKKRMIFRF